MEDFFLFGDAGTELLAVLILGSIIIACGWAFGAVSFLRFYKKRVRRFLIAGIMAILLAPVLAFLLILADFWLVNLRIGPMIHDNSWLGTKSGVRPGGH